MSSPRPDEAHPDEAHPDEEHPHGAPPHEAHPDAAQPGQGTPPGRELVREWRDGRPVTPDDLAWALALTSSLGCGYTVRIPYGARDSAPVVAAREQAAEVAALLGAELDEAPWRAVLAEPLAGPVEVTGLWEPQFRGPLGTARTRVTPRPDVSRRDRPARSVRLPWTYGSSTAVAGLPVLSPHEEDVAHAHLAEVGAEAGLWCDARGVLCTSTAGPLLLHAADGTWQHPGPRCGAVGHWLHDQLVSSLGSRPAELAPADLEAAVRDSGASLWAVDAWGSVTAVLGAHDGAAGRVLRDLRTDLLPLASVPSADGRTGSQTPRSTSGSN